MKSGLLSLSLSLSFFLTGSTLMATPDAPLVAPNQSEASAMSALLEQVLNSIDKTSLDIEVDDLSLGNDRDHDGTSVSVGYASLSGMLKFSKDWEANLIVPNPDEKADPQITRLFPKIGVDAKDLIASVSLEIRGENIETDMNFFSGYDMKNKTWIPRPITLQISNQMNKSLLSIRLHSLKASVKSNPKNPQQKDVSGSCESDKLLLDMASGKNKLVKVACEFSGNMSGKTYQIHFKYMNRK